MCAHADGVRQEGVGVIRVHVPTILHALVDLGLVDASMLVNVPEAVLVAKVFAAPTQAVELIQVCPVSLLGKVFPQAHPAETLLDDLASRNAVMADVAVASVVGAHVVAGLVLVLGLVLAAEFLTVENVVDRTEVETFLHDSCQTRKVVQELEEC